MREIPEPQPHIGARGGDINASKAEDGNQSPTAALAYRTAFNCWGYRDMTPIAKARFNWTDKIALAVALLLLALIGALWLFAFAAIGSAGAQHMFQKSGGAGLALTALAAGAVWVVLQGIDFTARGAWRLATRHRDRARLAEGSLIDGRPFRGTVSMVLPCEATPALAPLMARQNVQTSVRSRSNAHDLRARSPESLEAF
jgi:hypothetical protein